MANPWDKLNEESDANYVRFLIFRDVGVTRTVRKAYVEWLKKENLYPETPEGQKKVKANSTWVQACYQYRWVARALAWDIHNMSIHAGRVASIQTMSMQKFAEKTYTAICNCKPGDPEWNAIINSLRVINEWLTPEAVHAIKEGNAQLARAFVHAERADAGGELAIGNDGTAPDPDE